MHTEGFPLGDLSIVGCDFQVTEKPFEFVNAGAYAATGAETGAWAGGLFGLLVGTAFLVLPGVGPVVVAGPLVVALLGGLEAASAGATIGWLSGARSAGASPETRPSSTRHKSRPASSSWPPADPRRPRTAPATPSHPIPRNGLTSTPTG